jgi:hypothetical protein
MHHLCYQSTTKRVGKWACPISIGTTRLDLDASCNENGPNLYWNPTPCFLVLITIKCRKLVTMEAQALINYGASTCFMDKGLVWQYKLALVEKSTLVLVEVIDVWNFSLKLVTHKTKPLKMLPLVPTLTRLFSMSFHPQEILSSSDCLGLFYIIHEWISIRGIFISKHHNMRF